MAAPLNHGPKTTAEAKAALLETTERVDPLNRSARLLMGRVKSHPAAAVGGAVALGVVLGKSPGLRRMAARFATGLVKASVGGQSSSKSKRRRR